MRTSAALCTTRYVGGTPVCTTGAAVAAVAAVAGSCRTAQAKTTLRVCGKQQAERVKRGTHRW